MTHGVLVRTNTECSIPAGVLRQALASSLLLAIRLQKKNRWESAVTNLCALSFHVDPFALVEVSQRNASTHPSKIGGTGLLRKVLSA